MVNVGKKKDKIQQGEILSSLNNAFLDTKWGQYLSRIWSQTEQGQCHKLNKAKIVLHMRLADWQDSARISFLIRERKSLKKFVCRSFGVFFTGVVEEKV